MELGKMCKSQTLQSKISGLMKKNLIIQSSKCWNTTLKFKELRLDLVKYHKNMKTPYTEDSLVEMFDWNLASIKWC